MKIKLGGAGHSRTWIPLTLPITKYKKLKIKEKRHFEPVEDMKRNLNY